MLLITWGFVFGPHARIQRGGGGGGSKGYGTPLTKFSGYVHGPCFAVQYSFRESWLLYFNCLHDVTWL